MSKKLVNKHIPQLRALLALNIIVKAVIVETGEKRLSILAVQCAVAFCACLKL